VLIITQEVNVKAYQDLLRKILDEGERKENRTGIDTLVIPPTMIQHDMQQGFPLLTTKKIFHKAMLVELQGFIHGITDKKWYKERGCNIWNEWANPQTVESHMSYMGQPEDKTPEEFRKEVQKNVEDLGPIYGSQWRRFNGDHSCDQLTKILITLHRNPNDRRMISMAWNPLQIDQMALPACHLGFMIQHINGKLHLAWWQRSVDTFLGLPFNLASYAMLLHLICLETNMTPGTVTGHLVDTHLYENQLEQAREQISREPYQLPAVQLSKWDDIFCWDAEDTEFGGYQHHPALRAEVAV
jgi:thymidylate synthase